MKFTLVKLSALALVAAASTVSAEDPKAKLRGSSKAPPKLDGAVQTKVYLSDESPDHESADLKDASSDSNGFFPDEMNEEDKRNRNNRNRNNRNDDDDNSGGGNNDDNFRRPQKKNASQKRQEQRDSRRSRNNPNRSQREEQNERERKHSQAKNRSNRCADPSEPGCGNDNFPRNREAKRNFKCDRDGTDCNHHRSNPGAEPNRRRAVDDLNCIDDCRARGRDTRACQRICAAEAELAQE